MALQGVLSRDLLVITEENGENSHDNRFSFKYSKLTASKEL
jgi:hypothetical protein